MAGTIRIRLAKDAELDEINELDSTLLPPKTWHGQDHDEIWVAIADGHIVGYASIRESELIPGWAYLSRAGVAPDWRGHGLQKRLIRVRLRWAKRRGLIAAYTYTVDNPASANSLIACGFRQFRPKEFQVWEWWKKDL